jgi:hypothetical protein
VVPNIRHQKIAICVHDKSRRLVKPRLVQQAISGTQCSRQSRKVREGIWLLGLGPAEEQA